jgi:propionyl-CoA carboxylase beta subunit
MESWLVGSNANAVEPGTVDDAIMPNATRRGLAPAVTTLTNKHVEMPARKHDNLPV